MVFIQIILINKNSMLGDSMYTGMEADLQNVMNTHNTTVPVMSHKTDAN